MREIIIDNKIQNVGTLATQAFKELHKLQKGTKHLLKTGFDMLDCHIGGLLPGDVITIAAPPAVGKSQMLYDLLDSILDETVNVGAKNYISLEYSFEMLMLNKILRKTNSILDKKKRDILFNEFSEDEKVKVEAYHKALQDTRRYVCSEPIHPNELLRITQDFCKLHKESEAIIISIDHVLLLLGADKQGALEQICQVINLLKLEFKNVYFILLSQTNRTVNSVIKDKDNSMMPNNSMLFGSSYMEQLSSYIVLITNPFKQGITQYLKVNNERYDYLGEFFGDRDNKDRISFNTLGNLFYFITKTRESDTPYKDLFIRRMNLSNEQKSKMKQSFIGNDSIGLPAINFDNTPSFKETIQIEKLPPILPNFALADAFGAPDEDSDRPF